MIIQIIIIVAALLMLVFGLRGHQTHIGRAWKKIGLVLLVLAMIVAVLFPNTTNDLAHLVGVGRGADLLLYILTLAFIAYVLNSYVQQRQEKDQVYRLARQVALLEAFDRYHVRRNK
ncbi:MAG TPA: DUF2304 domain-containing protein [Candidatus Saccharimonadales bacterium]|nr:DUF2304 domain-containing protein [Candidatus Saccharimonadales bacterium]